MPDRIRSLAVCLVFVVGVLTASLCLAQTETATVSGRVTDASDAVIADARVEITNTDTNITATTSTNRQGLYVFPNLKPGPYRLTVTKQGFKSITRIGIVLHVQDSIAQNFLLPVGSITESITVRAGSEAIETSGTVSTVVDRQFAENLPLNGRSFQNLFELAPGVLIAQTSFNNQGQFNVNGQRADANYFMVDGVSANVGINSAGSIGQAGGGALPALTTGGGMNNLVSVDGLEEFRIQTSTYAAEFGRQPGGQISIVSRSGTNEFHGTLFNYFRNDILDANDWFANSRNEKKPALRQNDFGGVLGGPIIRNRTFFFFSYEGLRLRQPQFRIVEVPTMDIRQQAPAALQPLLNAYPIPNGPDLGNDLAEFAKGFSDPTSLNATSLRVDHAFSQKLTVFVRYNHAPSGVDPRVFTLSTLFPARRKTQTLTAGMDWNVRGNMVNTFRFNYSRTQGRSSLRLDDFGGAVPPDPASLFSPDLPFIFDPEKHLFSLFIDSCADFCELEVGANNTHLQRQVNLVDSFSVICGAHQLKFGVDYRWLSPIVGNRGYGQGFDFADFSEILANSASFASTQNNFDGGLVLRFTNLSVFAQDTWQATRRLTLTYGLRWEYNAPLRVSSGPLPLVVDQVDDPATIAVAGQSARLWNPTYRNFAPRVGVAYELSQVPNWGTVLRGGFGIYYDLGYGDVGFALRFNPVYFVSVPVFGASFPLPAAQAAPPQPDLTSPFSFFHGSDPNRKLPYTYQWNTSLEQALGGSERVSLSYVGAVSRRLLRSDFFITPVSFFTEIVRNAATSDYHALQVQFQRRLSRGLQAQASYTWSHSIDSASTDTFQLDEARASSDFDVRHAFAAAVTYNLPTPQRSAFARHLLGNWSLDTMVRARTSTPFNVIASTFNILGSTFRNIRPVLVAGQPIWIEDSSAPGGRLLNPNAFQDPPSGQQGDTPRNFLRGFDVWQADFAVRRQFVLREQVNLQFRADVFNIFNHPNFANPVSSLTSSFFGQSIQMLGRSLGSGDVNGGFSPLYQIGGPRSIQLALKLQF